MRKFAPQISFFLVLVAATITLACGSSPHTLKAISISPATAEGQAQFTAIAYYTSSPSPVKPAVATWGACAQGTQGWQPTSDISISSTGSAKCSTGASGTFIVFAYGSNGGATCNVEMQCGPPCGSISNTAQLTCP